MKTVVKWTIAFILFMALVAGMLMTAHWPTRWWSLWFFGIALIAFVSDWRFRL